MGSRTLHKPIHRLRGDPSGLLQCRKPRAAEPSNGCPSATIFGVRTKVFEAEPPKRIFENVYAQRLVV